MSPDNIAEFQSLLLEVLNLEQDASTVCDRRDIYIALGQIGDSPQERLRQRTSQQELVKYVETFDPVMLEIAAILVKKWGRD